MRCYLKSSARMCSAILSAINAITLITEPRVVVTCGEVQPTGAQKHYNKTFENKQKKTL